MTILRIYKYWIIMLSILFLFFPFYNTKFFYGGLFLLLFIFSSHVIIKLADFLSTEIGIFLNSLTIHVKTIGSSTSIFTYIIIMLYKITKIVRISLRAFFRKLIIWNTWPLCLFFIRNVAYHIIFLFIFTSAPCVVICWYLFL